jgi:iron complex transport system substrate-binding protein
MKIKNKVITLVEVAIVLCSLFLVALPGVAAEQTMQTSANTITTASEDDYVLGIYGNANEDDTIDMRDLTYVKLIFFGKKPETELADAKYDGKINPLDFIQIKLIIVGKEKEITIVDSADRIVTVKKPIKRVIPLNTNTLETMRSIKAKDKVIAIETRFTEPEIEIFFAEFSDYPTVGSWYEPDIEKILELKPDAVLWYPSYCTKRKDIIDPLDSAGITLLGFDCFKPDSYIEEVEKLGYVLGKKKEAEEFIGFYREYINSIKERTERLSEEERRKVYYECRFLISYKTVGSESGYHQKIRIAGGNNIFGDEPSTTFDVDPEEVIIQNPEFIVKQSDPGGYDVDDPSELAAARDGVMNRPELANVIAVKNGDVYIIYKRTIAGIRNFVGIGYMAKWFHPDLFEDLDPKAIHQRYLTEFQGLDYDLDEHGVFVYPEPS